MSTNETDLTSVASGDTSTKPEDGLKSEAEPSEEAVSSSATAAPEKDTEITNNDESEGVIEEKKEEDTVKLKETVAFKVVYNKQKLEITFDVDEKILSLKSHLEKTTSVPASMQKLMFKGLLKDDLTLRESKLTKGSKVMLVGSTVTDILSVSAPDPKVLKEEEKKEAAANKEPLSKQKPHKTILEKHGKPDDVHPGVKNKKERLPQVPLAGMYNKYGGKVRLTFKMELDQLWIGTKERTEKIPMGSIKAVVSETIEGHDEYHLLGIQLGATEASRYWVYWVPAQYVDAIKDCVLGKWQFF